MAATNGHDAASHTLRWNCYESGSSTAHLLHLLRKHASTLRQLRVANLNDGQAMKRLLETLQICFSLRALELHSCDALTGLPESLGHLAALKTLKLIGCRKLTGLPAWVEQRTTWVSLGLPSFIHALPSWVTLLVALRALDLSWCLSLTGLPDSLGQLVALRTLDLSECRKLTGLPESLGQLAALTTLNLGGCETLTGLPESLGHLAVLKTLNLIACRALTELPAWVEQKTTLVSLGLPPFIRELPGWIMKLSSLTQLNLSGCGALMELPESLGRLAAVTTLELPLCLALTGLPESLGQLTALTTLNLSCCRALTRLPESFGQLTALTTLNLSLCLALTRLPESLGQLAALTTLNLCACRALTGLPESLGQLTMLTTLNISSCYALTELPESVGQLTMLTTMNLTWCRALTGLPESVGQLTALTTLNLGCCHALTALPLSFTFLSEVLSFSPSSSLVFPPLHVVRQGMPAIKAFLLLHHHPLKMLLLILAARRRRMRHLPPELWTVRVCANSWDSARAVCAGPGTSSQQCLELGCCWDSSNASLPWCFLPNAPADWGACDESNCAFYGSNQAAPAANSLRGGARAAFTGDVAAVSCTVFPPFAAPCDYNYGALEPDFGFPYNFTVNGARATAAPRFRWTPYGVQRTAAASGGVAVQSEFRLLGSLPVLLASVSVGGLARGSRATASAYLALQFRDFASSVWGWDHPTPASNLAQWEHSISAGAVVLSRDTQSDAAAAASVWSDCGAVASLALAPLGGATAVQVTWDFVAADPDKPASFGFLVYVSRNASEAVQTASALNFSAAFTQAAAEWDDIWGDAFTVGNTRFSGSLPPVRPGGNVTEAMSSVYYMSVLSLLQNWKLPPLLPDSAPYPMMPYVIPSATPIKSVSAIYLWDTCYAAPVAFRLEPVGMRSVLEQLLRIDFHQHYALDAVSLTAVGPWYAFNDYNVHCLLTRFAELAGGGMGNASFWAEPIAGKRAVDWMDEIATFWQTLPPIPANASAGTPHLADYGLADNLLECVPTYLHGVPSLNAANVHMMSTAAAVWELLGTNASRAAQLRQLAAGLLPLVLAQYEPGRGYWACVYPDGSRHTVQHVIDFFTVAESIGPQALAGTAIAEEMVAFVNNSLLTATWMRALALADPAAPYSDRSDHGPYGAYAAWPSKTMDGLIALGKIGEAVALFDRVLPTFREGPLGQSTRVYNNSLLPNLLAAKAAVDQQYGASASASLAGTVMRLAGL